MTRTSAACRIFLGLLLVSGICSRDAHGQLGVLDSTFIIFHAHGADTTSRLGAGGIVPLGDVNADGFDDIAIGSFSPIGTYIFFGGNPVDTVADMFLRGAYPFPPIDLTGDGIPEMITRDRWTIDGHFSGKLLFYKGYTDSLASIPYDSLFPKLDTIGNVYTNWSFGVRGENQGFQFVDSDALGDLLTAKPDMIDGPTLYYYSGVPAIDTVADWSFREGTYRHLMSSFGFIDFDGDGVQDIFVGAAARLDSVGYVYIFTGPDFGDSPDHIIAYPSDLDTLDHMLFAEGVWNIGDVNGDGWEDLGVKYNFVGLIYYCGPGADTLYDVKLQYGVDYMSAAGDVNDDGFNDLLVGSAMVSAYGTVDLYLGGPGFDGNVDDGLARPDLPPLFLDEIGYRVASAGDFNGDGTDDFMFSCQNFAEGEPNDVFVIKGSQKIVTDVDEDTDPAVPAGFHLQQNYPNPFNSATTIEFDLPQRCDVSLVVFNVLGQKVAELVTDGMAAGHHAVSWDLRTDDGEMASGVYLYKLTAGDFVQTRKMVAVR